MLKIAYPYKDKLNKAIQDIVFEEAYKYFNQTSYWDLEVELSKSTWKELQFVSVDENDNILGYFLAEIVRPEAYIDSLGICNFSGKCNITFSRDLYEFLDSLFTKFNYFKITFCVVVGNPIEKMYDRFINKYGGRIVGYYKEHVMLQDGKYYDRKHYEIFRKDYISRKKKKE